MPFSSYRQKRLGPVFVLVGGFFPIAASATIPAIADSLKTRLRLTAAAFGQNSVSYWSSGRTMPLDISSSRIACRSLLRWASVPFPDGKPTQPYTVLHEDVLMMRRSTA